MHVEITLATICPRGTWRPSEVVEYPVTDFAPPIITIPDGLDDLSARRAAVQAVVRRHRRALGAEVARVAGRPDDFGSISTVNRDVLLWTVTATDGTGLGALEGRLVTEPAQSFTVELRFDIDCPRSQVESEAAALARRTGGRITAIFDPANDYDEL